MCRKLLLVSVGLVLTILMTGCSSTSGNDYARERWSVSGGMGKAYSTSSRLCRDISSQWDVRLVNGMAWTNLVSDGKHAYALINGADGYEVVKIRVESGGVVVSNQDLMGLMIQALTGTVDTNDTDATVFRDVPDDVSFQLTLTSGVLTLLSESEIVAIDMDDMRALWREKVRDNNIESVCGIGERVMCTTSTASVMALSARTGMPQWEQALDDGYDFRFVTASQEITLVYGFSKGDGVSITVALSTTDGEVLWMKESLGVATKPPQILSGKAYISESGKFSCMDVRNGRELWSQFFEIEVSDDDGEEVENDGDGQTSTIPARIVVTPALTEDYAFLVVGDQLKAMSSQNGRPEGSVTLPEGVTPKFMLASDQHLYLVADGEPFMYQYDAYSLELERRFVGGSREVISALITDVIILQTRDSIVCYGCR
jgi:outer membrane protein assembly factor BamB